LELSKKTEAKEKQKEGKNYANEHQVSSKSSNKGAKSQRIDAMME
jgi:hypothetical protein